ncbi:MAG: kinase/pyrophosphorylase [Desulforhopalus sp.]
MYSDGQHLLHRVTRHDDETGSNCYDEADLIIIGVLRSGKPPLSIFIASQAGTKTTLPSVEHVLMILLYG